MYIFVVIVKTQRNYVIITNIIEILKYVIIFSLSYLSLEYFSNIMGWPSGWPVNILGGQATP